MGLREPGIAQGVLISPKTGGSFSQDLSATLTMADNGGAGNKLPQGRLNMITGILIVDSTHLGDAAIYMDSQDADPIKLSDIAAAAGGLDGLEVVNGIWITVTGGAGQTFPYVLLGR